MNRQSTSLLPLLGLASLTILLAAACSSSSDANGPGPSGDDAGAGEDGGAGDDASSEGGPSNQYPAPHPKMPEVTSVGGPVLAHPHIVPVLFQGDTLANDITTFTQKIGGSDYWKVATSEYGVGAAMAIAPIVLADAPPTALTDADVQSFLATQLDGSHALGTPDSTAIYAVFYPASTVISDTIGKSCEAFGGYHNDTKVGQTTVAYAVLPRCSGGTFGMGSDLDTLTISASHEFVEAATDPFPQSNPAYFNLDSDHLVWALFPLPEVGDMCTFDADPYLHPADVGYTVQRIWSNASAAAGHNPCVPAPAGTYFNSVPVLKEQVFVDFGGGRGANTSGVAVPVGKSVTIDLALYSDAPIKDDWSLQAFDLSAYLGGPTELTFSLDKGSGNNGDTRKLTITRKAAGKYGGSEFMVVSASKKKSATGSTQGSIYYGFASN